MENSTNLQEPAEKKTIVALRIEENKRIREYAAHRNITIAGAIAELAIIGLNSLNFKITLDHKKSKTAA